VIVRRVACGLVAADQVDPLFISDAGERAVASGRSSFGNAKCRVVQAHSAGNAASYAVLIVCRLDSRHLRDDGWPSSVRMSQRCFCSSRPRPLAPWRCVLPNILTSFPSSSAVLFWIGSPYNIAIDAVGDYVYSPNLDFYRVNQILLVIIRHCLRYFQLVP